MCKMGGHPPSTKYNQGVKYATQSDIDVLVELYRSPFRCFLISLTTHTFEFGTVSPVTESHKNRGRASSSA